MKTTIDIADNLLARAKETARRDQTTLRSLVEKGLHTVLDRPNKAAHVRIRPVVVHGGKLTPEFQNATWEQIRDEIYRGRGA
jgi:hypothetical protein